MSWIEEFVSIMSGATITLDQIDRAHRLKNQYLPDKLYKFRPVNEYSLDNFRGNSVWVCSADKYNDPYECATKINYEELSRAGTRSNFEKIFTESVKAIISPEELLQIKMPAVSG